MTSTAIDTLGQDNFRLLAEDLAATLSYKPMIPAADLGITGSPLSAIGGDIRWAVLPGSTLMPAVSVRLSMSKSTGVDEITTRSTGYDVSVSKGFTLLTPYAGIGRVESKVNAPGTSLTREKIGQTKYYAGVNANLGLMNLALEGDRTGKASTYGLKVGFRF